MQSVSEYCEVKYSFDKGSNVTEMPSRIVKVQLCYGVSVDNNGGLKWLCIASSSYY